MNSENALNWALVIFLIVAAIAVLVMAYNEAHAAEPHAIVSFDDAEHLAVLTDSVIGVCDTVDTGEDYIRFNEDGSSYVYSLHDITCRELVCRTVTKQLKYTTIRTLYDYDSGGVSMDTITVECLPNTLGCKTISGIAIINYRRVKQ